MTPVWRPTAGGTDTTTANARRAGASRVEIGATPLEGGRCRFGVWAPFCADIEVVYRSGGRACRAALRRDTDGYFTGEIAGIPPGTRYAYLLDGKKERPDPASRLQPDGVHGPSCVVDPLAFRWSDRSWRGAPLGGSVLYEAHIGTLTPEGTFEAAIGKIPHLKRLGITCLELMPVAQFPGTRNWGYDGVGLYAVQNSYGGPIGLKRLVDACHRAGIGVCLDVVYNHLGPEGNYLRDFGPYFTDRYHTPWGDALNFDGPDSGPVRAFIVENALRWITEYHIDALRVDAVHGIYDFSARHILRELGEAAHKRARALHRRVLLIAESDLNDSRLIRPPSAGGYGLDAQWNDDFHHAVHTLLTGERNGYYADFGAVADLAKAFRDGFVYDGRYSAFRRRRHGNAVGDLPRERLVVFTQNHDQVGNRPYGDRLAAGVSFEAQKLAAALTLLSPSPSLIFMGQEYGETAPFLYFVDHHDRELIRAVREGRKREFASFGWTDTPDPKALKTFADSRLRWRMRARRRNAVLATLYRDLTVLKKRFFIVPGAIRDTEVAFDEKERWLAVRYAPAGKGKRAARLLVVYSFSPKRIEITLPFRIRKAARIFDTAARRYGGKSASAGRCLVGGRGAMEPFSATVYRTG